MISSKVRCSSKDARAVEDSINEKTSLLLNNFVFKTKSEYVIANLCKFFAFGVSIIERFVSFISSNNILLFNSLLSEPIKES